MGFCFVGLPWTGIQDKEHGICDFRIDGMKSEVLDRRCS